MIGDSNDEINFSHDSLLTVRQDSRLCKVFVNNSSANIKLLMVQLGEFLSFSDPLGILGFKKKQQRNHLTKNFQKTKLFLNWKETSLNFF